MSDEVGDPESAPVTRVEFEIDGGPYPFITASEAAGCEFELAEILPHEEDKYSEFFTVTGADAERILGLSERHGASETRLLEDFENGGLFEFVVGEHCPAVTLAEEGALPRDIHAVDGEGRIVAEIPPQFDAATIVAEFLEELPDGELVCKRRTETFTPMCTDATMQEMLRARLTERQREVLRAALTAGYYEWPRECTGQEIAEELGISSATFSEHVHAAERNLLRYLFDER